MTWKADYIILLKIKCSYHNMNQKELSPPKEELPRIKLKEMWCNMWKTDTEVCKNLTVLICYLLSKLNQEKNGKSKGFQLRELNL